MSPEKTRMVTSTYWTASPRPRRQEPRRTSTWALCPPSPWALTAAGRDALKPELALYIGGMGARTKILLQTISQAPRYEGGCGEDPGRPFLSGKRARGDRAVPDSMVDEVSLVGSPDRSRIDAGLGKRPARACGCSMILSGVTVVDSLRVVAEAVF